MNSVNVYALPIDPACVTSVQLDSLAHVGVMKHAIDFDAPEGAPVLAALDGIVVAVKDDSVIGGMSRLFEPHGNYIEILHSNGEVTEYEHLRGGTARVQVGDQVVAGDVIAEVGNTGWSECPHLHFMVVDAPGSIRTRRIRFDRLPCIGVETR